MTAPKITALDIERAKATRTGVIAAMGSDRGYDGQFIATETPCPACAKDGSMTNGGYTPRLSVRVPDGVVTQAMICQIHGEAYR